MSPLLSSVDQAFCLSSTRRKCITAFVRAGQALDVKQGRGVRVLTAERSASKGVSHHNNANNTRERKGHPTCIRACAVKLDLSQ